MMEKIKYLMEKYGLTEGLAEDVWRAFNMDYISFKHDNQAAIEKLKQASPKTEVTAELITCKVVNTVPQITEVAFLVNGINVYIDDPATIERLRLCAIADFVDIRHKKGRMIAKIDPPEPKAGKGRRTKGLLKNLKRDLMDFIDGTLYEKRVFAGRVLAEFMTFDRELTNKEFSQITTGKLTK